MDGVSRRSSVRIRRTEHPVAPPQTVVGSLHLRGGERIEMRAGWRLDRASLSFYRENGERIGYSEINARNEILHYIYIDPPSRGQGLAKYILAGTLLCLKHGTLTRHPVKTPQVISSNRQIADILQKFGFSRSESLIFFTQHYQLADPKAFYERIHSLGLTASLTL